MSTIGAAELLNCTAEALGWAGRAERGRPRLTEEPEVALTAGSAATGCVGPLGATS